jgi:hypothetical protein
MQVIMYKKLVTFFDNGQVNVSVSLSESSGFFISIDSFLHTKFTHFAASISVLKHPKYCCLPLKHNSAFHGFLDFSSFIVTPTYFEDFSKLKS